MRLGIDIGGTFTDFVISDDESGELDSFKLLSTPREPEQAVLIGLGRFALDPATAQVVHGSTVATNALVERSGARTAFVTTRGFGDLLTIGRQNRQSLYDFFADRPSPLVPPEGCFEVTERLDFRGKPLVALQEEQLDELIDRLQVFGADSVAICTLFSFLNPDHERRIASAVRRAGMRASVSSEILPEFREYERASTTAIDAYVSPVVDRYLGRLEQGLAGIRLRIMQSNGGSVPAGEARAHGARSVLSGPAAGVVGALQIAQAAGFEKVITFDMGGTSTDVSLAYGKPQVTTTWSVDGLPLGLPVIDIHTIGAGGGSIASTDLGGALRVGPQSAGAQPGPACYGRGGVEPTVTDANLVLGRLDPERFLGGKMRLDPQAAAEVLDALGARLAYRATGELSRAQAAGLGVVQVVNAHMARALRVISVERGHDPRDFSLVCFGGAAGLHARDLAKAIGMRRIVVPRLASTLCAFGMLAAPAVKDFVQTVMLPEQTAYQELMARMAALEAKAHSGFQAEGLTQERVTLVREVDLRYLGQSYELRVPLHPNFVEGFHQAHEGTYGYSDPGAPIEIVNLRLSAIGPIDQPGLAAQPLEDSDPSAAYAGDRPIVLAVDDSQGARQHTVPVYHGNLLRPGNQLLGPAMVQLPDTAVYMAERDQGRLDEFRNLIVELEA